LFIFLLFIIFCLDDVHLVGHIKSIVIGSKSHVSLLLSIGTHKGVHLKNLDVVELLHRSLDLCLLALIWVMKTRVLLASIFFMADSVARGALKTAW